MKRTLLVVVLLVSAFVCSFGQSMKSISGSKVPRPVCVASDKVEKSFIPPPSEFLLKSSEQKSEIEVEYVDFPEQAKVAFEYAVSIWESIIESDVPIRVQATWNSTLETNVLANCGPESYYVDFKDAPLKGRYYPVAAAEKIVGEELNGVSRFDIECNFSSKINWYYGTDGNTPIFSYDFVSVVLHEIAHGLGFQGFFFVDDNLGAYAYNKYGDATSFDALVQDSAGINLLNTSFFDNLSTKLKTKLESGFLYSNSPVAKSANSGQLPRLFAPSSFSPGSSIYHLNDLTYPHGNENSLMTHATGKGEAIHNPGPLAMGIMEDIGWTNLILRHDQVKDREDGGPLVFKVWVDSYYALEEGATYVVYSSDNFVETQDTLVLESTENTDEYVASLNVEGVEDVQYYVETNDVKNRVRTSPWDAPENYYNVHFGVDTEKPTIEATKIPYYLMWDKSLEINAEVDDNLGVDTVYVTYSVNDVDQLPFGLSLDTNTNTSYSGLFNFDLATLKDGDIITYNIVAIDASSNHNTAIYPKSRSLEFKVDQIYDPVTKYSNNFNEVNKDFALLDFDIYTANNFTDGALHSPHPYESLNQDNKDLNFMTFLKYPVIIQEDGEMSFDEVVLVEPGELASVYGDDDFWDYVIVEGSKDFGTNWYPLADGYDSGLNATWTQKYDAGLVSGEQNSETEGDAQWFVRHQISLVESGNFEAGDTILIRFRLYSDPYAHGWGWAIDNLSIQEPVSAPVTTLSPGNINAYPNPFRDQFEVEVNPQKQLSNIRIELFDMYGRRLWVADKQNISSFKETIDMQKYSAGLFLLKVTENGQPVLSKKMIKN